MRLIDFVVTLVFCGGVQARRLAQSQQVGPRDQAAVPESVQTEIATLLPEVLNLYCDASLEMQWRRKGSVSLLPQAVTRIVASMILSQESAAPRLFAAEVGRLALENPWLCHPAPTCFHQRTELRHDWFVVWAGLVKKHKILTEEDLHFYRALAEYETSHEVLNGGIDAAKRVTSDIFDAIKILEEAGTETSVEAEIG